MSHYYRSVILPIMGAAGLAMVTCGAQESGQNAIAIQPPPKGAAPSPAVPPPPAPASPAPVVVNVQAPTVVNVQPPATPTIPGPLANSIIAWDAELKETTLQPGETQAHFTFNLTNISQGIVTLTSVSPGCHCTVAQLTSPLPWKMAPGEARQIPLTLDVAVNSPTIIRAVTVSTDKGAKTLMIKATGAPPVATPAPATVAAPPAAK